MNKKTVIQVTTETRDNLRRIGRMHETYDSVINRLIGAYNPPMLPPSKLGVDDLAWMDSLVEDESAHSD